MGPLKKIVLIVGIQLILPGPVFVDSAEPTVAGDVQKWVDQLASAEYEARDQATQALISAGHSAIEPLLESIDGSNLEVAIRGVFILQELAMSGEEVAELAAERALQKVAADRANSAASRAREALARLGELRQKRALRNLQQLGAVIDTDYEEVGLTFGGIFAIEFGEKWQGALQDLRQLRWLSDVEQVIFDGPQVTDEWFPYLVGMEQLAIIKVRRGKITDEALATLPKLPRLHYLKLLYVDVGDASAADIEKCQNVAKVLLYGTKFSAEGATRLTQQGIDVDLRRGAFLGISVPRSNEGEEWYINEVTPGSSADKAGLRRYDVITKFGDREVTDFSSLMAMIAEYNVGDTVKFELRRQGEVLQREITFGEWQ